MALQHIADIVVGTFVFDAVESVDIHDCFGASVGWFGARHGDAEAAQQQRQDEQYAHVVFQMIIIIVQMGEGGTWRGCNKMRMDWFEIGLL